MGFSGLKQPESQKTFSASGNNFCLTLREESSTILQDYVFLPEYIFCLSYKKAEKTAA